ncbi:MAG: integrase family protein [Betaproteobacteria bacterium]|nr:integrase family protein [Betaproteobacteria bacterium]
MSKVAFTAGRISAFTCPPDKAQAFLWDATVAGLGLRATPKGKPSYIFQSVIDKRSVRLTIGSPSDWSIKAAQSRAREFQRMIDSGQDPRELERQQKAEREAQRTLEQVQAVTVEQAWHEYIAERRPHWGAGHYQSHIDKIAPGGLPFKRSKDGSQRTKPGPLAALMPLELAALTAPVIERWAAQEGKTRPTSARLAWRLLSVFLNWCAEHPQYAALLPERNPAKTRKARESLGKAAVKDDVLTREQLPAWFAAVRQLRNPITAAALQVMLLTGARPGEVLTLQWEDVNHQWRGLTIRDKVEGERTIPLTPYVAHLLAELPRRNAYVFAAARALAMDEHNIERRSRKAAQKGTKAPKGDAVITSAKGHICTPNDSHARACKVAGLEGLTLHGLRRSFSSLTEWLETPAGVVAQIQGHKPSATAEKHYKRRPLDLLRIHHERIEAWMLEQAGVRFAPAQPLKLSVVA